MSSLGSPNPFFIAGKKKALEIERSARFRGATDQRFDRTLSSTSSSYTISMWFKITPVTTNFSRGLFTLGPANNTDVAGVVFNTGDNLIFYGGNGTSSITTTRKFRDTSAWYYFTYSVNSNNFTAYINGESLQTGTVRSLDTTSNGFRLGGWWGGYDLFRGYIADFYLIDGLALTPSSFTETNVETGQLIPKKYTGSFGTSGAHLLFDDNSGTTATTLGKDSSGNSNNFTPISFITGDSVKDSPTNNFCTWNPLENFDNVTLSDGNLRADGVAGYDMIKGNMGVSSGKWYFEIEADAIYANTWSGGIHELYPNPNYPQAYWYASYYTAADYGHVYAVMDNNKRCTNGSQTTFTSDITAGDIVGFRLDLDNNELSISVNGTDKGKVYDIQGGVTYTPAQQGYANSSKAVLNCGQDSTFIGAVSSGGNTDENGIGDFKYAVPSGYKAICSANLPDPTILLPNKHFDTILYTGNGGSQTITYNYLPDWAWIKSRSSGDSHFLMDSVRGIGQQLATDDTSNEANGSAKFTGYTSTGYTLNTSDGSLNANSSNYVSWGWNAGDTDGKTYTVTVVSDSGNKYRFDGYGTSAVTLDLAEGGTYIFNYPSAHPFRFSTTSDGTHGGGSEYTTGVTVLSSTSVHIVVAASAPQLYYFCTIHSGMGGAINTNTTLGSSNFDGAIQSTVKVNATAGFSIGTWVSDGSGSPNSFGHGLGVRPDFVIIKDRDGSGNWQVWSYTFSNATNNFISLNLETGTQTAGAAMWGTINSSVVNFRHSANSSNGNKMIGYFFNSVEGYSKFGKYTGNGNTNGVFIYTGFRPAWVMIKTTQQDGQWIIIDNKRDPHNVTKKNLRADEYGAENTSYEYHDFCANGFKLRTSSASRNPNNQTVLYFAFAESPFKNARAR